MYLDVLNDNMVGFANISARDMMDHFFSTYGNITAVDLEINFEHMNNPRSSRFKIVQIILRQEVSSLDTPRKSTLDTPKYLQLDTS
jgi:hypothetical protein